MTAPTPEQMRQQADKTESVAEGLDRFADRVVLRRSASALRTAADQLEAVERIASIYDSAAMRMIRAILATDAAAHRAEQ